MQSTIAGELERLVEEFDLLGDWEEQIRYVIDLGRELAPLADEERSDQNRVRGCASNVWLVTRRLPDGRIELRADSDAHIPKGLIAVLLRLYSGRTPEEIAALDPRTAVERLKLDHMITSQRANGLGAMVERIRKEASAPVSN